MRLLLINYEMDPESRVLAWQLSVATELAKQCERVVVLTNKIGSINKPENMYVYRFPRLLFRAPLRWVGGKWYVNFYVYFICRKHSLDVSFVHMNLEWVYKLSPVFRLLHIPVLLWYAHGTVSEELEKAHQAATRVVTSTPDGFRLPSNKVVIIGQGVDAELFRLVPSPHVLTDIVTVGRVSARKRIDLMLDVLEKLTVLAPEIPFRLFIIGDTITEKDKDYHANLLKKARLLKSSNRVHFLGHVSLAKIPQHYRHMFLHLNLSKTGSMDKTVMEALAVGCPVLTTNEAFKECLVAHPEFYADTDDPLRIADRILELRDKYQLYDRGELRNIVLGKHDLASYSSKIMTQLCEIIT